MARPIALIGFLTVVIGGGRIQALGRTADADPLQDIRNTRRH